MPERFTVISQLTDEKKTVTGYTGKNGLAHLFPQNYLYRGLDIYLKLQASEVKKMSTSLKKIYTSSKVAFYMFCSMNMEVMV